MGRRYGLDLTHFYFPDRGSYGTELDEMGYGREAVMHYSRHQLRRL